MADWRQIQARIRKAKNAQDAPAKLSELYKRTRDAMVAWELAVIEEKAEHTDESVKWYTIAAQRFRRADWKKKAEEALARLGVDISTVSSSPSANGEAAPAESASTHESVAEEHAVVAAPSAPEAADVEVDDDSEEESSDETQPAEISAQGNATSASADAMKKKRRRGRRGGRGRRRSGQNAAGAPRLPQSSFASPSSTHEESRPSRTQSFDRASFDTPIHLSKREAEPEPPAPQLPSERTAHGRAGDPGLSSRIARLESTLRRLMASPLHRLDEADQAPAGPGVFLLSDSDQTTSYYVESCQTLRVGIGNLGRSNRNKGGHGGHGKNYGDADLKAKLAEHLGINENKVSQYLKDHCVIRWIQLDDDAPHLANFAIAVLRTPLNIS